jgi:NifB/MoaA-like Fe-S oxidoreductase
MAQRPFPAAERYDGFAMHEDGIGMARTFEAEFNGAATEATGVQRGFFAAVDAPPNPAAYTGLRQNGCVSATAASTDPTSTSIQIRPGLSAPVAVLTGALGAPVISPLIDSLDRSDVRVLTVENHFFGGNTGVTGLMTGEDVRNVLMTEPHGHRYLIPDVCLSDDGRFLDGMGIADLPRPVEIIPTDGIALRAALETAGTT